MSTGENDTGGLLWAWAQLGQLGWALPFVCLPVSPGEAEAGGALGRVVGRYRQHHHH